MSARPGRPAPRHSQAALEIDKPAIGFAAAHFSLLDGQAETIHGHNYRVRLRAVGPVRSSGSIVDFAVLKDALSEECAALDHSMLIPAGSDRLQIEEREDGHVEVREGERRFLFPAAEVRLLPVTNTTCECLAGHFLGALRRRLGGLPVRLEVGVEESPGQGATVSETG